MVSLDRLHTIAENGLKDQLLQLGFDVSGNVCFQNIDICLFPDNANLRYASGYECSIPAPRRTLYWIGCPRLSWILEELCPQSRPMYHS